MSDEIIVKDETITTTIISENEEIKVVDSDTKAKIISENDIYEVDDVVGEKITINATELLILTPTDTDLVFGCLSSDNVGDAVYLAGNSLVNKAINASILTAQAIGFITLKTSPTSCRVRISGLMNGFVGLIAGNHYFLGSEGELSPTPPTAPNSVIVRLGQAISSSSFLININNNYTIRS